MAGVKGKGGKAGRSGRKPTGRYDIESLVEIFDAYTENSQFPIIKECCFINNLDYTHIMNLKRENDVLDKSIKRLLMKKEIIAEQQLIRGTNNGAFIFILKQLGWRDGK